MFNFDSSNSEQPSGWSNELDEVPLMQRRKLLLLGLLNSFPAEDDKCSGGGEGGGSTVPLPGVKTTREHLHSNTQVDPNGPRESIRSCLVIPTDRSCIDQSLNVPARSGISDNDRSCVVGTPIHTTTSSQCCFQLSDNCSGTEPTDMQNHIEVQGPEYQCSGERQPSEQNGYCGQNYGCEPHDGVNISATHGGMVLLDSDMVLVDNDKIKDDGWSSELDNMPLLLRREMLLMSKQSPRTDDMYSSVSPASERSSMTGHVVPMLKEEKLLNSLVRSSPQSYTSHIPGEDYTESAAGVQNNEQLNKKEKRCPNICNISAIHTGNSASELRNAVEIQKCHGKCSSKIKSSALNSCNGMDRMPPRSISSPSNSTVEVNVKIKVEPADNEEMLPSKCGAVGGYKFGIVVVKTEENANNDAFDDMIDHMLLRERMKLLTPHDHSDSLMRMSVPDVSPVLGSVKPISIKRPWKRKRTATDSVKIALEEDAPGLLRVLADSGVSVDEIKLYGNEDNELADEDESCGNDSFSELEDVILKLFSQRQSLIKMGHLRSTKETKPTYCLACLFSLVEQTRYLQFRKWPVEWGWSRDLQSFIFVFERHKRIVLERPEYGYATYFFELVDSLPVGWQIKRLVTAMKLSSCSRVTLMENKALLIGEDLSEGEAKVLMQFGWIPNSGLGTMLNYCDRVVHDRKNDKDTSEWRAKIGKLLIDGYNGGRIVPVDVVDKISPTTTTRVSEYDEEDAAESSARHQIKLEI